MWKTENWYHHITMKTFGSIPKDTHPFNGIVSTKKIKDNIFLLDGWKNPFNCMFKQSETLHSNLGVTMQENWNFKEK